MTRLNVIDLDGTLLPYDSFRKLVLANLDSEVVLTLLMRMSRLCDRKQTAERLHSSLRGRLADDLWVGEFCEQLKGDLRLNLLAMVNNHSLADTTNLLLSASPTEYVSVLADHLGFEGVGSHWSEERYHHMYGDAKREYVLANYPADEYAYNFALADSASDQALMDLFETSCWV